MTDAKPEGANQLAVATALGLTDRRVRQLIEQKVLPAPHHEKGYDLALCKERYALYSGGSMQAWDDFFDDALAGSEETAALFKQAFADAATLEDVTRASVAVQADMCRMQFMSACKGKSQSERDFFRELWAHEEDQALRQLLARAMALMGKTHIRDHETGRSIEIIPGGRPRSRMPAKSRKGKPAAALGGR